MELNIMTHKKGAEAKLPYHITQIDFWKLYIRLLYGIGQYASQREEEVLSLILSLPPDVDYFLKPHNRVLKDNLGLSSSEITRYKGTLKLKRYIGDDNMLVPPLAKLQRYVQNNKEVTFTYPLVIV